MKEKRKVAVVSGGLGGVGRAVCARLAQDGFDIVALYLHTPHEVAEAFIRSLPSGNHMSIRCDVRNTESVGDAFAQIANTHDGIYACIHAAVDPILRRDLLTIKPEELEDQLSTSFIGGLNVFKNAALFMKKAGEGRIVGILSSYILSSTAHKKMAGYLLAKHALRGLLRELHLELAPVGIVVTAIAPEFLDTKLSADVPKEVREFIKTRGVYGSMKEPKDVAEVISFLCSERGGSMAGKIYSPEETHIVAL
ncbi:MAG: SDR family oxidoreductase [bacterium]|nr:SDR family oxidoreductase [bacterium]